MSQKKRLSRGSQKVSETFSEKVSETFSEKVSETFSEPETQGTEKVSEKVSETFSEPETQGAEKVSETFSEPETQGTEKVSETFSEPKTQGAEKVSDEKVSETFWSGSRLALSLLIALALYAPSSALWRRRGIPSAEAWREAVEALKPQLKAGDVVTWRPEWADEARPALKALEGEGVEVIYPPHHGAWELGRVRRLWVLSSHHRSAQELVERSGRERMDERVDEGALTEGLWARQPLTLVSREQRGAIELSELEVGGPHVVGALYEDLAERVEVSRRALTPQNAPARACELWALGGWHCRVDQRQLKRVSPKGAQERSTQAQLNACLSRPLEQRLKQRSRQRHLYTLDRRRHLPYVDCGLNPIEHVSRDVRVIEEEPRRCVWLAPHQDKRLTLTWRPSREALAALQTGNETGGETGSAQLELAFGWEDLAIEHPFRQTSPQPLTLTLKSAQGALDQQELLSPKEGWRRLAYPLSKAQRDELHTLTLTLEPPIKAGELRDAHLCVDLTLVNSR